MAAHYHSPIVMPGLIRHPAFLRAESGTPDQACPELAEGSGDDGGGRFWSLMGGQCKARPTRQSGVEAEVQEFGDRAVPAFVGAVVLMIVAALAGGGFGGAGGGGWAGGSFLARLLRA